MMPRRFFAMLISARHGRYLLSRHEVDGHFLFDEHFMMLALEIAWSNWSRNDKL